MTSPSRVPPRPKPRTAPQVQWTARLYALAERELSRAESLPKAAEALAKRTGAPINEERLSKAFARRVVNRVAGARHAGEYLPQNACVGGVRDTIPPEGARGVGGVKDTIPPEVVGLYEGRPVVLTDTIPAPPPDPRDYLTTMPAGHRVKGNSTLLDENDDPLKRWVKTEKDPKEPPTFEPVPEGFHVKKVSTLLDSQKKVSQQWVSVDKPAAEAWAAMIEGMKRATEGYRGLAAPALEPVVCLADLLTVYVVGDAHIGMHAWARETGEDFDLKIAEREILRAIDLLVEGTPSSEKATFLNVGDWFHVQGDDQRTPTSGVKLDADSRFGKIAEVGFRTARAGVDRLLTKHRKVNVVNVPGNHDPHMAHMMALWLKAIYEKEPRVTIQDNSSPYMYEVHGKNLIGYFHGNGARIADMPALMAADRAEDWGRTVYRTWYGGHVHHKVTKEFPGCTVEQFQTLAGKDAWHGLEGYRARQSMTAISLDKEYGESVRSKVDIRLVRATKGGVAA